MFFAGTPDRAMLTADGQIPSCSRTRRLRGRPGSRSPGPQHRLFIAPGPHREGLQFLNPGRNQDPAMVTQQGSFRARAQATRKPVRPHPADEFQGIPGRLFNVISTVRFANQGHGHVVPARLAAQGLENWYPLSPAGCGYLALWMEAQGLPKHRAALQKNARVWSHDACSLSSQALTYNLQPVTAYSL